MRRTPLADLTRQSPFIFRFLKISTVAAANEFLKTYVDGFNAQFAVPAQDPTPVYTPPPDASDLDLLLASRADKRPTPATSLSIMANASASSFHVLPVFKLPCASSERQGVFAFQDGVRRKVELAEPLCDSISDAMPRVEKDLIARYFLADKHDFAHRVT